MMHGASATATWDKAPISAQTVTARDPCARTKGSAHRVPSATGACAPGKHWSLAWIGDLKTKSSCGGASRGPSWAGTSDTKRWARSLPGRRPKRRERKRRRKKLKDKKKDELK